MNMKKVKKENELLESAMMTNEPAMAYDTSYLQVLKNRLMSSVEASTDEATLEECLSLFNRETMPCVYTDEELAEEIRLAEASGFATDEEVEAVFAKWKS